MTRYSISVFSNISERLAQAEVSRERPDGVEEIVALVYESSEGWHELIDEEALSDEDRAEVAAALVDARMVLAQYVNRRGENPPDGLTDASLSLWLLKRADGDPKRS